MNRAITHTKVRNNIHLPVSGIPFGELPGQSRLFLAYLEKHSSLTEFYPNVGAASKDLMSLSETVLAEYRTERGRLADALFLLNQKLNASEATLRNIDLLRENDTVAVVTGQQAGIFTGPLYTIYKALSAIKQAEILTASGQNAVPIFWTASEDHDFDEVSETFVPGKKGGVARIGYRPANYIDGLPVGRYKVDAAIEAVIAEYLDQMDRTAFTDDVRALLEREWSDGVGFADAFSGTILRLLGKFGIIVIDPLAADIRQLAAPILTEAVDRRDEIVAAVRNATDRLESLGFHSQVQVEKDYVPFFWHDEAGRRTALRKTSNGNYRAKDGVVEFSTAEMREIAADSPGRLSPGVVLRPVVQDYLLPTICYFGGAAEVAYFAQIAESYKVLSRPVTPIFPRQSFTIVASRQRKALNRFDLTIPELFQGKEQIQLKVSQREFDSDLGKLFADVEENINTELHKIDQRLSSTDPTLAGALATRRRKILYHIAALRRKTLLAEVRRDEVISRQIDDLFLLILPNGGLQERSINIFWFINKYGLNFIDWLYEAVDLDDDGHRVIDL